MAKTCDCLAAARRRARLRGQRPPEIVVHAHEGCIVGPLSSRNGRWDKARADAAIAALLRPLD